MALAPMRMPIWGRQTQHGAVCVGVFESQGTALAQTWRLMGSLLGVGTSQVRHDECRRREAQSRESSGTGGTRTSQKSVPAFLPAIVTAPPTCSTLGSCFPKYHYICPFLGQGSLASFLLMGTQGQSEVSAPGEWLADQALLPAPAQSRPRRLECRICSAPVSRALCRCRII